MKREIKKTMRYADHIRERERERILKLITDMRAQAPNDMIDADTLLVQIRTTVPCERVHLERPIVYWSLSCQPYRASIRCTKCGETSIIMVSEDNGVSWSLVCGHTDEDQEEFTNESQSG